MKKFILSFIILLVVVSGMGQITPINPGHLFMGNFNSIHFLLSKDTIWRLRLNKAGDSLVVNNQQVFLGGGGGGATDTTSHIKSWKYEVTSNSQNNFSVSFPLIATSVIIYNSTPLENSQWSGIGTSTLSVAVPTKQYDKLTIIK
jgi:hypothetical protein